MALPTRCSGEPAFQTHSPVRQAVVAPVVDHIFPDPGEGVCDLDEWLTREEMQPRGPATARVPLGIHVFPVCPNDKMDGLIELDLRFDAFIEAFGVALALRGREPVAAVLSLLDDQSGARVLNSSERMASVGPAACVGCRSACAPWSA